MRISKRHLAALAGVALVVAAFFVISNRSPASKDVYVIEGYDIENPRPSYAFVSEQTTENGVTISYPRVVQYSNQKAQEKINKLLANKAKLGADIWSYGKGVSGEVGYTVTFANDSLISVAYSGYFNVKGAAHPANVFYTQTIGLENLKELRLNDFYKIDKSLVEYILYKTYTDEAHKEAIAYLKDQGVDSILSQMKNADKSVDSSVQSYLTPTGVGISFGVPHVLGDYLQFEYNYDELAQWAL